MASDDLRARIADAIRAAACDGHCGRSEEECAAINPIEEVVSHFGQVSVVEGPVEALAEVVLAVVQPELDRLRAELHRHATCSLCGHERHRHGYEPIIRRDWCSDCPTSNDLHTFQTKESS